MCSYLITSSLTVSGMSNFVLFVLFCFSFFQEYYCLEPRRVFVPPYPIDCWREIERESEQAVLVHPHSCMLKRDQARLMGNPESKNQGPEQRKLQTRGHFLPLC